MKFNKSIFTVIILVIGTAALLKCQHTDNTIEKAVRDQLKMYPESTLQDIYKSFFQDEFGPGHLLSDTAAARKYLEYELSQMVSKGNYIAEPCGTGRNFWRAPLDLVKDGKIPMEKYLDAFIASASAFKVPDSDEWKGKWKLILQEIESMGMKINNFNEDKKALTEMLERGETVVHHSKVYTEKYKPHYRIIRREQLQMMINNN